MNNEIINVFIFNNGKLSKIFFTGTVEEYKRREIPKVLMRDYSPILVPLVQDNRKYSCWCPGYDKFNYTLNILASELNGNIKLIKKFELVY